MTELALPKRLDYSLGDEGVAIEYLKHRRVLVIGLNDIVWKEIDLGTFCRRLGISAKDVARAWAGEGVRISAKDIAPAWADEGAR